MRAIKFRYQCCLLALGASLVVAGCTSGSTDEGDDARGDPGLFNSDGGGGGGGGSAGAVDLDIVKPTMAVAETGGFSFRVTDASGDGVPDIRVACDSEQGIAILEPSTGFEQTGGFGAISGVIGCEAPGSFQFGCRVPVGGGRRQFKTVKCTGEIPAGFAGFPGAAGGGLGGGVVDDGSSGDAEITEIQFLDDGTSETPTTSIDISQGVCGDPPDQDAEPFFDTSVKFKVVNNSNAEIRLTRMNYSVSNFDGAGTNLTSDDISLIGIAPNLSSSGGTVEFQALFMDAVSASGTKRFFGTSTATPAIGFRNITFRLFGQDAVGESVQITARAAASFDDYDSCS